MQVQIPVVFIIFNRPDTTHQVFESIRKAKPSKLFVIADGARIGKAGEAEKCQQCRDIIKQIDWDCEVITNFSDVNLGCKERILSGLNWVFENTEEAIILEDDCLPDQSFFSFCQEMLLRYKYNEEIMSISGTNLLYGTGKVKRQKEDTDYYFSRISGNWGWATWKRAWKKNDANMLAWPTNKEKKMLELFFNKETAALWDEIFHKVYNGEIKTAWDYQWYHSILSNSGICIMPHGNLISNIGFGGNATNTFDSSSEFANLKIIPIHTPLNFLQIINVNNEYDKLMNQYFYTAPNLLQRVKNRIKLRLKKVTKF